MAKPSRTPKGPWPPNGRPDILRPSVSCLRVARGSRLRGVSAAPRLPTPDAVLGVLPAVRVALEAQPGLPAHRGSPQQPVVQRGDAGGQAQQDPQRQGQQRHGKPLQAAAAGHFAALFMALAATRVFPWESSEQEPNLRQNLAPRRDPRPAGGLPPKAHCVTGRSSVTSGLRTTPPLSIAHGGRATGCFAESRAQAHISTASWRGKIVGWAGVQEPAPPQGIPRLPLLLAFALQTALPMGCGGQFRPTL